MIEILDKGRVGLYGFEPIQNCWVSNYTIYGKTNGNIITENRQITDTILSHVFADINLQDKGPKIICGDFNCDIDKLPSLVDALQDGGWYDLGAMASAWGGLDNDTTCEARPGASTLEDVCKTFYTRFTHYRVTLQPNGRVSKKITFRRFYTRERLACTKRPRV